MTNAKDVGECISNGYIGCKGYFSDDKKSWKEGVLRSIMFNGIVLPPYTSDLLDYGKRQECFHYFIPVDKVVFLKEPAKKYRPYLYLIDFPFKVGDVITYRCKQRCSACDGIVTEIEYQNNEDFDLDNIIIGGINSTPQELFDHYEFLNDDCEWVPFGVKE